jgi:RNA polymerase sigma-70 factor (ECF subfamily)
MERAISEPSSLDACDATAGVRPRAVLDGVAWPVVVRTVHRQMRSLVGPMHRDLEDLTQAALEQVLRGLPRFEGRAELTTFTYRICAHVAMTHSRGWRRWLRRFQFWTEQVPEESTSTDVGQVCMDHERARRLEAHLERLSPTKRICITLGYFEGLPAARIAEILECPEPTVRSRLRLARVELASMLRADPYFQSDDEGREP